MTYAKEDKPQFAKLILEEQYMQEDSGKTIPPIFDAEYFNYGSITTTITQRNYLTVHPIKINNLKTYKVMIITSKQSNFTLFLIIKKRYRID